MKKFLKPLAFMLIGVVGIGCSSDDNSNGDNDKTKELIVLESMNVEEYEYDEQGVATVDWKENHVYSYDENGRLITVQAEVDDFYDDIIDKQYVLLALTYDDAGFLKKLKSVDSEGNVDIRDYVLTYDVNNMLVSYEESVENERVFYKYNDKKQVVEFKQLLEGDNDYIESYSYNEAGQLAKAENDDIGTNHYSYDTKNNPYLNMVINLSMERVGDFLEDPFVFKPINNVVKVVSFNKYMGSTENLILEHEYNTDGFPVKTSYYQEGNKSQIETKVSFVYKKVKVAK
ncbi:RHS repeat domain-containing protein [Myroides guanonis]|uniref:Uncharacterized protein n=1 Tax=Myroides guanonis TaxID=1150112 RepID=A0A1I3MWP1_9FLAO|nr:hypothetical protein [Myroides guanonis]SFJ01175.1 hypothetical protein SAMN04487893_102296 [Myroides guanonis]